ncbi:MAG: hypothetical protein JW891_17500 [Candidatus Lokiarchaeota archaeon]|nr:hypothetical protein [Candidatus Lokiarchaeota archaeon]
MSLTIVQFPINMVKARDNLRDFDNDRELYSFSPSNSSGSLDLASFVFLPQTGRFELKVFCDDAIDRWSTPFTVSLLINVNINEMTTPITLAQTSYSRNSYYLPNGVRVVDPQIDKSWKSSEYGSSANLTLDASWSCNFNGWYLKVLYDNDTLSNQRASLVNAKTAASVSFGAGLGVSITMLVVGIVGTVLSTVFYVVKKRRNL